jgi:hypothetical protein
VKRLLIVYHSQGGATQALAEAVLTFYPAQGRVDGLPWALVVKAGNDGANTVVQVERIARGYKFRKVADPVVVQGDLSPEDLRRAGELGQALAAGLAFGIY